MFTLHHVQGYMPNYNHLSTAACPPVASIAVHCFIMAMLMRFVAQGIIHGRHTLHAPAATVASIADLPVVLHLDMVIEFGTTMFR